MPRSRIELPQTLEECHALILEIYEMIDELRARVAQLERELYGSRRERFIDDGSDGRDDDADTDVDHNVNAELPTGNDSQQPSPSDPFTVAPLVDDLVTGASIDLDTQPTSPDNSAASTDKRQRTSSGRRPRVYPPDTPRVQVYHPLDEQAVPREVLRHPFARRFYRFVREEVELPQRQIRIVEHYQEVIAVDNLRTLQSTMFVGPMPEPLLDCCYVGNSLLAYLAVSRFADHLPYYREEDIIRRSGLSIPRSTQWRWMRGLSQVVLPLVQLIRERLLSGRVLGIDETPCPILDPTLSRTRKAYLYAQYGDDTQPYVGYYFADHKTRASIESMLHGFQGVLQSDAYICYELITAASLDQIQPAACWAHGRRKFEPLLVNGKHPKASWILKEIQKLYDIEDRARGISNDDRFALRQAESRPIVDGIRTWFEERHQNERPRAAIRQGVNYFLNRWTAFTRFLEDGAIPIDNNRTEAVIKGPVMGKKAWLFLGNQAAGETAAIMYTLSMSCKRHCIDPSAYLFDVMNSIKTASPDELEAFLPDRWIQTHPEAFIQQRAQESHAAAYRKRTRRSARRKMLAKQ